MKIKIFLILIIPLLSSCGGNYISLSSKIDNTNNESVNHDYPEIKQYKIEWNDIFIQAKTNYFVYFYSLTCSHCASLKNKIIEYALLNKNVYFCSNSEEVKITKNIENTIGKNDIKSFAILGFPSLVKVEKSYCVLNIAGEDEISKCLIF